jgi:modification methylase
MTASQEPAGTSAAGRDVRWGTSVWPVGQRSPASQRRGRYVPGSQLHPARMWPDLAAHAIDFYSRPGDLVLDPLCGTGTTLVEAIRAGRDAIGVELETRWAHLAGANVELARAQGGTGRGSVIRGDATTLTALLPKALHGSVDLVLTSPPYGRTMHGRVEHRHGPLTRFADTYTPPGLPPDDQPTPDGANHPRHSWPATATGHVGPPGPTGGTLHLGGQAGAVNLAHRGRVGLIEGIHAVLTDCATLLRPGGIAVLTARPWRRNGHLVDLPGLIVQAGIDAGLQPLERCVALLAAVRDDHLLPRHSFFQLSTTRRARRAGRPVHLICHEDVLAFQAPLSRLQPAGRAPAEQPRPANPAHPSRRWGPVQT